MNPPPRDLFAPERPVRSDFARERSYARRRVATVCVLLLIIGGIIWAVAGKGAPRNPADIPTVAAAAPYKEKPADPGGIEIPHQDMQIYDALDGKGMPAQPVEHLLPPPETPEPSAPPASAPPPPDNAPVAVAPAAPVAVAPAPVTASAAPRSILPEAAPRQVPTTAAQPLPPAKKEETPKKETIAAAPPPKPAPAPPPEKTLTIADVIRETEGQKPAPAAPQPVAPVAAGNVVVQLASSTDEARARAMMADMQGKYASALSGVQLRLVRADLGRRGVFWRIQSEGMSGEAANRVCSALKQRKAGCIIVGK